MSKRDVSNNRYKKSYQTKGGESKSVLNTKELDVSFFKTEPGKMYKILIIPYIVGSDNHPDTKKGDLDYLLDIWVHRRIGAAEMDVVCPKLTYSKPCSICEEADSLKDAGKDDEYAKIKASRRVAYNIVDTGAESDTIKLLHTSHYLFEKELIETAMGYNEEEQIVPFASLNDGKMIQFRVVKGSGGDWNEFKAFQFKDRPDKYTPAYIDKLVDKAIPLDTLIKVYSYEELKAILYGGVLDEEDDAGVNEEVDNEREKRRQERLEKRQDTKSEPDNKCPAGLRFGIDLDSADECETCRKETNGTYSACEEEWVKAHEKK